MASFLQFQFRHKPYEFRFRIGFTVLCLFLAVLCCTLGFWQLHRYDFKKKLLVQSQQRLIAAPIPFKQLQGSNRDLNFQKASAEGHYVNSLTLLIQNKFYNNQRGFEVLTPFQIKGEQKLLLVDRGWMPQSKNQNIPSIDEVRDEQSITGYIKLLDEHQFILGQNILNKNISPLVAQKIDIDEISQITHQAYYPFILRLDASQSHGFVRDWVVIAVEPQRHMAYAIQWFVMAIVLCIAYFCFCCERKTDEN